MVFPIGFIKVLRQATKYSKSTVKFNFIGGFIRFRSVTQVSANLDESLDLEKSNEGVTGAAEETLELG